MSIITTSEWGKSLLAGIEQWFDYEGNDALNRDRVFRINEFKPVGTKPHKPIAKDETMLTTKERIQTAKDRLLSDYSTERSL